MYHSILWLFFIACHFYTHASQRQTVTISTRHVPNQISRYTISFGGKEPVTCNFFPHYSQTESYDEQALSDAIEGFGLVEDALASKTKKGKIKELLMLAKNHNEGIYVYQILVRAFINFSEHKDKSAELAEINQLIANLDEWLNPYFARLCFEYAHYLKKPSRSTPFLTYLKQHQTKVSS